MTSPEEEFLIKAHTAALAAGHIFPDIAACEAALSSDYGRSDLSINANNLFNFRVMAKMANGIRIYSRPEKDRIATDWLWFETWTGCFAYRMDYIRKFTMHYEMLRAKTVAQYLGRNPLANEIMTMRERYVVLG
jgi:hypothetical protein